MLNHDVIGEYGIALLTDGPISKCNGRFRESTEALQNTLSGNDRACGRAILWDIEKRVKERARLHWVKLAEGDRNLRLDKTATLKTLRQGAKETVLTSEEQANGADKRGTPAIGTSYASRPETRVSTEALRNGPINL